MKKMLFLVALLAAQSANSADFVKLADVGDLAFGRNAVSGQLEIIKDGRHIAVPIDAKINYYPHGAFEFGGKTYLLVYDVAANVPSGRRLSRGAEESDLYVVNVAEGAASFDRVASLPLGIDINLRTVVGDDALACGTTACLLIESGWSGTSYTPIAIPSGYEIVELEGSYILLQKGWDDLAGNMPPADEPIFSVCSITTDVHGCKPVPADVIPYRLQSDGTYRSATDGEDLIRFDYDRLGIANYAETNLEARIAWSKVYFLSGLASLYKTSVSEPFKVEIKSRLTSEIEAISRLAETAYPGLAARRYSMDREPITFLLHLSRTARTIEHSRHVIGDELADKVLSIILPQIRAPSETVEKVSVGPRPEVQYRKYMPFWADGVNVPWNYQNGWIEAVSLTTPPEALKPAIASMISTFVEEEGIQGRPDKWSYAGGIFRSGWSDGQSSYTPEWAGQKSLNIPAHISYRSMDALALLAASEAGIPVPSFFEQYAADLISRGLLYPFEGLSL